MTLKSRPPYRGPLKMAVFDWAGTTVDYGCFAPAVVFVDVFKNKGIEITMQQAREPMGMNKKDHVRTITEMKPVADQWQKKYGRSCAEADVEEMYREFIPRQLAILSDYSDMIPGALEAIADCRRRGMKIGTSTGYDADMLKILLTESRKRGFVPDSSVSSSDVPAGRPHPWMCVQNAMNLGIYPMEACVKIGDTVPDVLEGKNAGMWTIAVVMCGNEVGLLPKDFAALAYPERERRRTGAYDRLSGAHYVVDTIGDVPRVLDDIEFRLLRGECP